MLTTAIFVMLGQKTFVATVTVNIAKHDRQNHQEMKMATRKKKDNADGEVKVVKGSHLTVTTFPDGSTKLEWDDEALARDVREAVASVELVAEKPVKAKATRKKKE